MGFEVGQQSPGLVNTYQDSKTKQSKTTNLFDQAVELSKDGDLSAGDLQKLEATSQADGNATAEEKLFIQGLKDKTTRTNFVDTARKAAFDPQGFTFEVNSHLQVPVNGERIDIEFASDPPSAKRVTGDREAALQTIKDQLPPALRERWDKNVHNLGEMKKLFAEMAKNDPNDPKSKETYRNSFQRMALLEAYMTAYYNHPGVDINWKGVPLQDGINAMPKDAQGRKYVDCEGYSQIAEEILGKDNVSHFDVASGAHPNGQRDHQVSVVRNPDDPEHAYVISNNSVKRVDAKSTIPVEPPKGEEPKPGEPAQPTKYKDKTPQQMILEAHPDFANPVHDDNGPMRFNSNNYQVGAEIELAKGKVKVLSVSDNQDHVEGKFTNPDNGEEFHVRVMINPKNGETTTQVNPQQGDIMYEDAGQGERYKYVVGNRPPAAVRTKIGLDGNEIAGSSKDAQVLVRNGEIFFKTN